MATHGAIARLTSVLPIGWAGRICYWDAYPTGLGRELWTLYHDHFGRNLDRMLAVLLDEHPAGWKILLAADKNVAEMPSTLGVCLCHGEHSEASHLVTDGTAQTEGVRWAYVFASTYADQGENTPMQRYDTLLVLCAPNWQKPRVVDLRGAEPDWEEMEAELDATQATSTQQPAPATAHVCLDEGRPYLYRVQFPHAGHHYVGEHRDEQGQVQTYCTCSPDEEAPSPDCPHARAVRHYRENRRKHAWERQARGLRYTGQWLSTGDGQMERWAEVLVWEAEQPRPLDLVPSLRLHNHSPGGFAWGYTGSGPAQLALAILLDYLGDEQMALAHYQAFKTSHVSSWPQEGAWELGADEIEAFLLIRRAAAASLSIANPDIVTPEQENV